MIRLKIYKLSSNLSLMFNDIFGITATAMITMNRLQLRLQHEVLPLFIYLGATN